MYKPKFINPIATVERGRNIYSITVEGEEYALCEKYSKEMWANTKKGNYGEGILNSNDDPYKTERTGFLGEMAFAKMFPFFEVNFDYIEHGDAGWDFKLPWNNTTLDVKTASKDYDALLVQSQNENGTQIPLKAELYVAAYIHQHDHNAEKAIVHFVGVTTNTKLKKMPDEWARARHCKHRNKDRSYSRLCGIINFRGCVLYEYKKRQK